VLYGAAGALDGSGYLAVFLAGMVVGERRNRHEREVVRFAENVAGIAEMVAFVVLGLSVDVAAVLRHHVWLGLGVAALTIVVVRPVFVGAVLAPIKMSRGERGFVLFSGLKGAVPMLLGTYVVADGARHASRIYDVIFVVVVVSVALQGALVPVAARLCRVPMRRL
jgi:cell volume regulation protein A